MPTGGPAFETPALLTALVALALGLSVLLGWASGLSALSAFLPGAQPQSRRFVICPPERVAHVVKRD